MRTRYLIFALGVLCAWASRIGTIEQGKSADLIAVDGDPVKDVCELAKIRFVMKSGRIFRNDRGPY